MCEIAGNAAVMQIAGKNLCEHWLDMIEMHFADGKLYVFTVIVRFCPKILIN
jgi:hypothetical protein